jgi:hypothetical protein
VKFKVGDLVRVKDSTNDEKIPENRHGLVVDIRMPSLSGYTHICNILMTNGSILRFHEMFLEKVEREQDEKED